LGHGRRVILTRPSSDSQAWVSGLQHADHQVLHWPLIDIAPVSPTPLFLEMLASAANSQAIMFVSRNAVTHALAAGWQASQDAGPRCWATGPGTRQALLEAGVPAARIDAPPADAVQFDTEALWHQVQHLVRAQDMVWIFRGADADNAESAMEGVGRDWLQQQLQHAGVTVKTYAVYQRICPHWDAAQVAQASAAASDGSVWVFTSSQALTHLNQLLPAVDWKLAKAIATHERIAHAAQQLGVGHVWVCKPALGAVLSLLESLA
ncbi:MAG: uroporphyrinogen-III synthase, partial [Limnohabitans sp.]